MGESEKFHKSPSQIAKNVYDEVSKRIRVDILDDVNLKRHQSIVCELKANNELLIQVIELLKGIGE